MWVSIYMMNLKELYFTLSFTFVVNIFIETEKYDKIADAEEKEYINKL